MSYEDARRWLYDRIDYERMRPVVGQSNPFRLERTERLLKLIGAPHLQIPCVHIAGTKGKGSTAAMLESILRQSGLKTGLFTSPHIDRVEERMRINGEPPDADQFAAVVSDLAFTLTDRMQDSSDHIPTFFESTTLLAWLLFDQSEVDIAILETGLGGRLDCTNVCSPLLTVITSIGLDHTHILGDTIEEIAAEKAGIMKRNTPAVIGDLPDAALQVVRSHAKDLGCKLLVANEDFSVKRSPIASESAELLGKERFSVASAHAEYLNLELPLLGSHQAQNAAVAVQSAEILSESFRQISTDDLRDGLARVSWPLRFETVQDSPAVIVDAAHNPDSCAAVVRTLAEVRTDRSQRILVFGVSEDKDAQSMLDILIPHFETVILTKFTGNPRGIPVEDLMELVDSDQVGSGNIIADADPASAIDRAIQASQSTDVILVTGSLFLAAEARNILRESHQESDLIPKCES